MIRTNQRAFKPILWVLTESNELGDASSSLKSANDNDKYFVLILKF